jgi:uncharacterized repeat protein (TIGR03803 family)
MPSRPLLRAIMPSLACITITVVLAVAAGAAPKYKVLHAFAGGKDGGGLWGSLVLDNEGSLYGPAGETVFRLAPQANGNWKKTVLHRFGYGSDGSGPNGSMVFDAAGNLYGTTQVGGPYERGVVFELSPGSNGWKETVLTDFPPPARAGNSDDGPIMDGAGNLYGTAGSAFELSPGSGGWKFTNLHEFLGRDGDGADPYAGPIRDAAGNLYGTTSHGGGSKNCGDGCGTAWELSPEATGRWKETILHRFGGAHDGAFPGLGALAMDRSGNLYGTTDVGGQIGYGTVFELTPGSDGKWKETIVHSFAGGAAGDEPSGGVVMDQAGNLYGTTIAGGSGCDCGVVYKLAPGKNGKWTYTVLHTFIGSDGAQPDANLILDGKGNLYGTTATGGAGGYGVAFELTP